MYEYILHIGRQYYIRLHNPFSHYIRLIMPVSYKRIFLWNIYVFACYVQTPYLSIYHYVLIR